ncbi:MAG: alpha/beta hydrolase [Actinomycetota bacterium]
MLETFIEAQQRMLDRSGVQAESRFVDAPVVNGRAHVLVSGSGPPVVMINGIGTPAAMWAPLMPLISGHTLYAVDQPAYGLTNTTEQLTDDLRSTAVLFLEQVIDQLELERPVFIGNSLGSLWTTWMAIDRPGRVAALVHVGCPALFLDTSAPLPMRMLSVPALARVMMRLQPPSPKQVEQLSRMVRQHPLTPELAALLLETERLPGFEHTFLATLHTLLTLRGARPEMALTAEQLARVDQPVQLIWGDDDPMGSPAVGERARHIMAEADLHVVSGGHTPWLTDTERIGKLVASFLNKHDQRRVEG